MRRNLLLFQLIWAIVLMGCQSVSTTATPIATPSGTPIYPPTGTPTSTPSTTATPTSSPTDAPTLTPTLTQEPTASMTATPSGGGSGQIVIWRRNPLELWSVNLITGDTERLIDQRTLSEQYNLNRLDRARGSVSPDGRLILIEMCGDDDCSNQNYVWFLATTDLTHTIRRTAGGFVHNAIWAPDGRKVILQTTPSNGVVGRSGLRTLIISTVVEDFGESIWSGFAASAYWDSDSETIFYYRYPNFYRLEGFSNSIVLPCDACSMYRASYAGALSPDGTTLAAAFIESPFIIVASASLDNLSEINTGREVSETAWSYDGRFLLIEKSPDFSRSSSPSLVRLDVSTMTLTSIGSPAEFDILLCGNTPDRRAFVFVAGNGLDSQDLVYVLPFDEKEIQSLTVGSSCPGWLPFGE